MVWVPVVDLHTALMTRECPLRPALKWVNHVIYDITCCQFHVRERMKWQDIWSAVSCRLHDQNSLERRVEWDEECKNILEQLERVQAPFYHRYLDFNSYASYHQNLSLSV